MKRQRYLPLALGVLTLARLALLPLTELSPVEAHAALCSQDLDLWHPMTGPLLPLLMRLSTAVFGLNEFGVRFFAPFLMLGAGWLVWKLANGLFDVTTAAWAIVIFQVTPIVNVAAVTFTNTTLAIAESAALLVLLRQALHRPLRFHLHWWAVAGMAFLAFITDWRLVVFSLAGIGCLALTRRGRTALLKWPVLPILGGTLVFALVLFLTWNSEHGWIAFHFPGTGLSIFRGVWHHGLLAYGIPLIALLGWSVVDITLQRPLSYAPAFLLAFAWPLISLDFISLHNTPWPQAGFAAWLPPAVMLAAARLMQTERITMRAKVWIRSTAVLAAAFQSCIVLQPHLTRTLGVNWSFAPPHHAGLLPGNPARDLTGWRMAANQIREALSANQLNPAHCFLMAEHWDLSEPIAFQLRNSVPPIPWPHFDSSKDAATFNKTTTIFITDDASLQQPPKYILATWPNFKIISVFTLNSYDQPLRTLKIFACSPAHGDEK
ncbi:MAG: glycosyltransferase family 39 protein [Verrucomicrobia bacterium]|nr:glycosyltransferase family 39 protein [Verrucomicrobiota bacterium]